MHRWSATEVRFLRSEYRRLSGTMIARRLKRTVQSVLHKLNRLGLQRRRLHAWSKRDLQTAQRLYGMIPHKVLARKLGASLSALRAVGVRFRFARPIVPMSGREKAFVKHHYRTIKAPKIAKQIGRTLYTIYNFAQMQNLRKNKKGRTRAARHS